MKKVPIDLWWSYGKGDSSSYETQIEISDKTFDYLLDLYNTDGIPFDGDLEDYAIPNTDIDKELSKVRQQVFDEFKNVEKGNWKDILSKRYSEYDKFEDYFDDYFIPYIFRGIRINPWTDLNKIK